MKRILDIFMLIDNVDDPRQKGKIKYPMNEIIGMVLFASLGNANEWPEIEFWCKANKKLLKRYFILENGVPSHDTFQRVMSMINPKAVQFLSLEWNRYLSTNKGEKIKKILSIDGKTMRGSRTKYKKPLHVVSAYCHEDGFCLGQNVVNEKENEIVAIPELLKELQIKGYVVTIDAMGTQVKIAEKIKKRKADYVLAVKGNQETLFQELIDYFKEFEFKKEIKAKGNYKKTVEKSHSQIEIREYYQTDDIKWLTNKNRWYGLKSIGVVEKTIRKNGKESKEIRYYISSLIPNIELFSKSVREHWQVEVMHWHLDVTFREDANKTIEAIANENMNIIRKWSLSILKLLEMNKKMSLKLKRFAIGVKPDDYIDKIMQL